MSLDLLISFPRFNIALLDKTGFTTTRKCALQGRRNRGGQGGLGLPNIFQQSESALFQQSYKHFLFSLAQS